ERDKADTESDSLDPVTDVERGHHDSRRKSGDDKIREHNTSDKIPPLGPRCSVHYQRATDLEIDQRLLPGDARRLIVSNYRKANILPSADPSRADEQACSYGVCRDTQGRRRTFDAQLADRRANVELDRLVIESLAVDGTAPAV